MCRMIQVLFRIHLNVCHTLVRIPRSVRTKGEHFCLNCSLVLVVVLAVLHAEFVSPTTRSDCLPRFISRSVNMSTAHVLELQVHDSLARSMAYSLYMQYDLMPGQTVEFQRPTIVSSFPHNYAQVVDRPVLRTPSKATALRKVPPRAISSAPEAVFYYATERALLLLWARDTQVAYDCYPVPNMPRHRTCYIPHVNLNITVASVMIPADLHCFGGTMLPIIVSEFVGYETILVQSLFVAFGGKGYAKSLFSGELFPLKHVSDISSIANEVVATIVFKLGAASTAIIIVCCASSLTSFILRHTQSRMLQFTAVLSMAMRTRRGAQRLIFSYLIESLVFIPIMLGVLFFFFEFFGDQLLAFMLLVVVWLAEFFSAVSVRTMPSIRLFPRCFLALTSMFLVYFLTNPFGFSYVAFTCCSTMLLYVILALYNHAEVPAVMSGAICAQRLRETMDAGLWTNGGSTMLAPPTEPGVPVADPATPIPPPQVPTLIPAPLPRAPLQPTAVVLNTPPDTWSTGAPTGRTSPTLL